MGLTTSTYYYKPKVSRVVRDRKDADLRDQIEFLQVEYSAYGYRTIKSQLLRHYGLRVNSKRIRRIMRKYNLFQEAKKRFISTTDSNHDYPVYPNLLKGVEVKRINQVWVSDITYIRIQTGFVYLAVVLDIYSRRVVGWALSKCIDHMLTVSALQMAIKARQHGAGIIHHSDRGVQYACKEYVRILEDNQFEISMSAVGNPYDNAFAESFMKTLKKEEVYLWEYESFTDVVERVPQFIETVYNRKRVHSGIQYLPPVEFEAILQDKGKKHILEHITLKLPD